MQRTTVVIVNQLGLHARAAARFVQTAMEFASDIDVTVNGKTADGKSIMGLMMLTAAKGATLELTVSGPDENNALAALNKLILDKFGEEQ